MSLSPDRLDPEQRLVVEHFKGPALVLAGPGSGKTWTVVRRVVRLLERGVSPGEITLVTFTKKAAKEMERRLERLLGEEVSRRIFVNTFHGLAYRVVKESGEVKVLPADEARTLLGQILADMEGARGKGGHPVSDLSPKVAQGAISRSKNASSTPEEVWEKLSTLYADFFPLLGEVYRAYEAFKRERGLLDFEDLLRRAIEVLEGDAGVRERWRKRARFLSVDEYQDTNMVQFRLLQLLLGEERNILVVGDPNQAIYSWRGADYRIILAFKEHFPEGRVYTLTTNYRSHEGIVEASKRFIASNQETVLPLKALRPGDLPYLVYAESKDDEALFVAEAVRYHLDRGIEPEEVAILLRSLAQSRLIEAKLRQMRVPYVVLGGLPFWARREVKFYLDLLRFAVGDLEAGARVVAGFLRGVGPKKALEILSGKGFPSHALPVAEFLDSFKGVAGYQGEALALAVDRAFKRHDDLVWSYLLRLSEGDLEQAEERARNLEEAVGTLYSFARQTPEGDIHLYLGDVLVEEEDGEEEEGRVRIMTVHRAKGLEFEVVFMPMLVNGVFPMRVWERSEEEAKEERRVFYVGMTRAKERLYLSYHEVGERGRVRPSKFLREVPTQNLPYTFEVGFQGEDTGKIIELGELFE